MKVAINGVPTAVNIECRRRSVEIIARKAVVEVRERAICTRVGCTMYRRATEKTRQFSFAVWTQTAIGPKAEPSICRS